MPIMSFAQIFNCVDKDGGYYRVTANSGLNLRIEPNAKSEIIAGIPYGSTVYSCNKCESYPNEIVEGREGCWKKVYFSEYEGYVFSGFLELIPKIDLMCPVDWESNWRNPALDTEVEYFGIFEEDQFRRKSKVVKIEVRDTLIYSVAKGKIRIVKVEGEDKPDFIVSNLPLHDGQEIMGTHYNQKMLFPGESVIIGNSCLYATGTPISDPESIDPFSAIENYKLFLRVINDKDKSYEEVVLFTLDIPAWGIGGYEGGVKLRWVGDLDNDGKLDLLLTNSTHYACWDVILLLSSKAIGNQLVGEAAKYTACGC